MDPIIVSTNNNDESTINENVEHLNLEIKGANRNEDVDETDLVCDIETSVAIKTSLQMVGGEAGQDNAKVTLSGLDNERMSDSSIVDQHKVSTLKENVKHVALVFKGANENVDETDLVGKMCDIEKSVAIKTSPQKVGGEAGQDHAKVPKARLDERMSDSSIVDQHKEHCSDSTPNSPASKIPVSTKKRGKKSSKRKSIKLPSVDSNNSNDRLFDEIADESQAMSTMNFSDGAIDDIIRQSCKKSNEKILDSTADDLDGSDDNLLDDDKRQSVCDSIVSKFLEVTTNEKMKKSDDLTYLDVNSPNPAVSPVMNIKADYLQIVNNNFNTSTPSGPFDTLSTNKMAKHDLLTVEAVIVKESLSPVSSQILLVSNDDIKTYTSAGLLNDGPVELPTIDFFQVDDENIKESVSLNRLQGSNEDVKPSTLAGPLDNCSMKTPDKDLLKVRAPNKKVSASPVSLNRLVGSSSPFQSTNVEYLIKGFGDKSALFENKIDSLESRLAAALEHSQEKNEECDHLKRKITLFERELDISDDKCNNLVIKAGNFKEDFEGKDEELRMLKAQYNQLEKEVVIGISKEENLAGKLKDSISQLEQHGYTIKSLEGKLLSYEEENCRMEDDLKAKNNLNEKSMLELDDLKRKYKFLELEMTKLEETSSSLSLKLNVTNVKKEENEDAIRCLQNAVLKSHEETTKKEQQITDEEGKKVEKEKFKLKLALFNSPKLPEPVRKVAAPRARKNIEMTNYKTDLKVHDIEDVPTEDNEKITNSYRSLTEENGRLEDIKIKLITDMNEKESKLIEKEQEIAGFRNKYEIAMNKLNLIEDQLKVSSEKLSETVRELEEKERYIKKMESLTSCADEKNKVHDEKHTELKNKCNNTEAELENKERNIIQLRKKLDSSDVSFQEIKGKFTKLELELETAMETSKSLQFVKQQNDDEIDLLSKKKKEDSVKMNGLEAKLEEVEKSLKFLEHDNGRLSEELDKLRTQQQIFVEQINLDVSTMLL